MALTIGQLASSAGYVSQGMRQAEEAERQARENQLKIEAQNRADEIRRQEAQRLQAGLQVPNMPQFAGMTGGQQFGQPGVRTTPAPAVAPAPAAPVAASTVGKMTPVTDFEGGVAQGIYPETVTPTPPDTSTVAGRYEVASSFDPSTPLGRAGQQLEESVAERQKRDALRTRLNYKYGPSAGFGGMFMSQTAEQRQFAQDVMDRLGSMSVEELEYLDITGELPPVAAPKAGVQEPAPAPAAAPAAQEPAAQQPTAPAAPTAPTKPTKNAVSFDNRQTPYDQLIVQAANQYGVDPVILKRLLGTESNFDPNAVGKADGRDFGIAQINQVHIDNGLITREQAFDPNIAIPFAAELLADNLSQTNGDYYAAIMRYKGVKTAEGRDKVISSVNDILSGTSVPGAQTPQLIAAKPANTADNVAAAAAAPAASGVMYGPSAVPGGMQNPGIQSAIMLRQILADRYRIAAQVGSPDVAIEALTQIAAIDLGLFKAQGDLGAQELITTGDASRAMSVFSQFTGTPTQALARGDGTYDLYQNGRLTQTAVPVQVLADLVRTTVNAEYRAQKTALDSEVAADRRKAELEFGKIALEGNYKLAAEQIKKKTGAEVANLGDGRAIITYPDGRMAYFDGSTVQPTETAQGAVATGVRPTPIIQ